MSSRKYAKPPPLLFLILSIGSFIAAIIYISKGSLRTVIWAALGILFLYMASQYSKAKRSQDKS
jgi:uncharacterized membrane protein